ncbi:hypothetical protein [Mycobacterium sp.]|uniref:hypothetical protein n=1 Tax=Mycobacterium sp. TaxID=1785 RepID=UPI003C78C310
MSSVKPIGRVGMLAVGLGIGMALAASPRVASADDMQISIDGFDLFPTAGNTAIAVSGPGDIAIAFGNDSEALAAGGFGDVAIANGGNTSAQAGDDIPTDTGNNFDFASVTGSGSSLAEAGFGGSFDSASVVGNDSFAHAGFGQPAGFLTNFDFASVIGDHSIANAQLGSDDIAFVSDPFGSVGSTAVAGSELIPTLPANFDLAGLFGDNLILNSIGDLSLHILPFF